MRWITKIVSFLFGRRDDAMLPLLRTDGLGRKEEPKIVAGVSDRPVKDLNHQALHISNLLLALPEPARLAELQRIQRDNPTLHALVKDKMCKLRAASGETPDEPTVVNSRDKVADKTPEPFPGDKPAAKPAPFVGVQPTRPEDLQSLMRPDPEKTLTSRERSERVIQASAAAAAAGVGVGFPLMPDEISKMFAALPRREAVLESPRKT